MACNVHLTGRSQQELQRIYTTDAQNLSFDIYKENQGQWLMEYAMYCAICEKMGSDLWQEWPEKYHTYSDKLYQDTQLAAWANYFAYTQFYFEMQWKEVRDEARQYGIRIIGDMPMFVAPNSADVWAHPELFVVDTKGYPIQQAGVPPDYFAKEGQIWGNPLYRWQNHEKDHYAWWMQRFERMMELYDYVRLDHFRGFDACYGIRQGKTAAEGSWFHTPGVEIFKEAVKRFDKLPFIAEDLGFITPCVRELAAHVGLPGMDIMPFYEGDITEYKCQSMKVAYTGTHDNEMFASWVKNAFPNQPEKPDELLKLLYNSDANLVMVPLQDAIGLDNTARMNTPGTKNRNWKWQAKAEELKTAGEMLTKYTTLSKRG